MKSRTISIWLIIGLLTYSVLNIIKQFIDFVPDTIFVPAMIALIVVDTAGIIHHTGRRVRNRQSH